MDNLLKEAIADAKAVRETALENAKMALEEAFTPKLQSMLSKKIQMEMDDEDEKKDEAMHDDEKVDEAEHEDDVEERAKMARDGDELEERGDEDLEERGDDDLEERGDDEKKDEGIIEIDGVKYAPVVSEEDEDDEVEEGEHEEVDEDADLDLEAVIKELEAEINEEEEDEKKDESVNEEDEDKVEENDVSSDIGKSDNKVNKKAGDSTGIGKDGKAKLSEDIDEDIDLDEVLKALSEEEEEDEKKDEVAELKANLDEHRSVIEELRGKLNEVNLLNAKLLFTNKLFRKYGLNNEQKMKVVEQFDRASNLREVKLVYSTLGESFGTRKNEINESKGSASKPVASTKSEKEVITESSELRNRFKKLANIL
mgnify:CR=1 FL=1